MYIYFVALGLLDRTLFKALSGKKTWPHPAGGGWTEDSSYPGIKDNNIKQVELPLS